MTKNVAQPRIPSQAKSALVRLVWERINQLGIQSPGDIRKYTGVKKDTASRIWHGCEQLAFRNLYPVLKGLGLLCEDASTLAYTKELLQKLELIRSTLIEITKDIPPESRFKERRKCMEKIRTLLSQI